VPEKEKKESQKMTKIIVGLPRSNKEKFTGLFPTLRLARGEGAGKNDQEAVRVGPGDFFSL